MAVTFLGRWITRSAIVTILTMSIWQVASSYAGSSYPVTPEAVVKCFCVADSEGLALSAGGSDGIFRYTTWKDTPGWDHATIIQNFKIISVQQSDVSAQVGVSYRKIGTLESGASHSELHLQEADERISIRLVKAGGQWKISKPMLPPHISLDTAIKLLEAEVPLKTSEKVSRRQQELTFLKSIRDIRR